MTEVERSNFGLHISGGTFNAAQRDINHFHIEGNYHSHESEDGLKTLSRVISADSLHDAAARFPPPKCHPETRKIVRNIITSWIDDPHSSHKVMWLHGSAGVGKSPIAQTIAEWCCSTKGRLAGSFFFSRGSHGKEQARCFFLTVAYQLALNFPGLRRYINDVMTTDPILPKRNLDTQLEKLIIEPFRRLLPRSEDPSVIIVDGLDECADPQIQKCILQFVSHLSELPLRVLITSRPEAHIRETFEAPSLSQKTYPIVLDGFFKPDRDIKIFLQYEFGEIAKRKKEILAHVAKPWPPKSAIDHFVTKASGQFFYATTLLEFVNAEDGFPHDRLAILQQQPLANERSFSNLDELYNQILGATNYSNPDLLLRILTMMVVLHCSQPPEVYEDLLGVNRGYVAHTLRGMHSLIKFPNGFEDQKERALFNERAEYDQSRGLRLRHASFKDFLLDSSRSGKYFLDLTKAHVELTTSGIRLFLDRIARKDGIPPSRETWGYLKEHMSIHLSQCPEGVRQFILEMLEQFQPSMGIVASPKCSSLETAFDSLHSLITTLVKVIECDNNFTSWSFLNSEHSHWANETVLTEISRPNTDITKNRPILELCQRYCKLLDEFYLRILSPSNDIIKFLASMPGFIIWRRPIPIDWLEDIFGIDSDTILANIHQGACFIHRWESHFWMRHSNVPGSAFEIVSLNAHFVRFLSDREHAGEYYQDSQILHINACRNIIKVVFCADWLKKDRQNEIHACLEDMLKQYLETADIDGSKDYSNGGDNHPEIALLKDFTSMVYDIPCLEKAPPSNVQFIWGVTRKILHWIQIHKSKMKKCENPTRDFNKMFKDATDNIYRQILRLRPTTQSKQIITLCRPFMIAVSPQDYIAEAELEDTVSPTAVVPISQSRRNPNPNHISDVLLALHGVRYSLLEFLTREERAGSLYIPQNAYHTQFAEICLGYCDTAVADLTRDWRTLLGRAEWRFHLERAQPNAQLLSKLREIRPGPWLTQCGRANDSTEKIKSVQAIISWLENTSRPPSDIISKWKGIRKDVELNREDIEPKKHKSLPRRQDLETLRRSPSE